jgi:PAS domain-containing protein
MAGDIIECPEIEAALRESEERYHQLVELFPDLVVVHSEGKAVISLLYCRCFCYTLVT